MEQIIFSATDFNFMYHIQMSKRVMIEFKRVILISQLRQEITNCYSLVANSFLIRKHSEKKVR